MVGCSQRSADTSPPFPKIPYTAHYDGDFGTFTSDGKGRILISHGNFIRVEDYPQNTVTMQSEPFSGVTDPLPMDASNAILEGATTNEKLYLWSEARRKRKWSAIDYGWAQLCGDTFSSLGEKVIDGHNCRGWVHTSNYYPVFNQRDEYWFDKDGGYLVLWSSGQKYPRVNRLESFSNVALPPEAFDLPISDTKLWTLVTDQIAIDPHARSQQPLRESEPHLLNPNAAQQHRESLRHARYLEAEQRRGSLRDARERILKFKKNADSKPDQNGRGLHMQPMRHANESSE